MVDGAKGAATYCLELIGIMALWLGLMNIAKDAGLVDAFGGMSEAIAKAADLAKLGDERGVRYL